jgi:hypothetical protein
MFVILIKQLMLLAKSSIIWKRIMTKVQKKVGCSEFNIISTEIYLVTLNAFTILGFKHLWFVS